MMLAAVDERITTTTPLSVPMVDNPRAVFGPWHYAPRLGGHPLYILAGKRDPGAPEARTKSLYALVPGGDKTLQFYDCRHRLPPEYVEDLIQWYKYKLRKTDTPGDEVRGGG